MAALKIRFIWGCGGIGRHIALKMLGYSGVRVQVPPSLPKEESEKLKNVERRATEPVRWPPINWGVGGSRQMRISCNPLLLFIWADAGTGRQL